MYNKGSYTMNHRKTDAGIDHDWYATHPNTIQSLIDVCAKDKVIIPPIILEPACGQGHIAKVLEKNGFKVIPTDLIDRGYGTGGIDFFTNTPEPFDGIITNPPYQAAAEFIDRAIQISPDNGFIAMLLKITFLETKKRYDFFKINPPKYIYVFVNRQGCGKGGGEFKNGGAALYSWMIWIKGSKTEPIIRWIV